MWGNCAIITTISILDLIIVRHRQCREENKLKGQQKGAVFTLTSNKRLGLKQGEPKKQSLLLYDMDIRGVPSAATPALVVK